MPTEGVASEGIEIHFNSSSFGEQHQQAMHNNRTVAVAPSPSSAAGNGSFSGIFNRRGSNEASGSGHHAKRGSHADADADADAASDKDSEGCWYVGSASKDNADSSQHGNQSHGKSPGQSSVSSFVGNLSPKSMVRNLRARTSSKDSYASSGAPGSPASPRRKESRGNSFDSFDSFHLGPPAPAPSYGAEDQGCQGEGSLSLLPRPDQPMPTHKEQAKEMPDLSEGHPFVGPFAETNSPSHKGDGGGDGANNRNGHSNGQNNHQDNKSQDTDATGGTGESTVPGTASVATFTAAAATAAAAGTEAVGGAAAAAAISRPPGGRMERDVSGSSSSVAGAAGGGLGLARRHTRRASHPPRLLSQHSLEAGYETVRQFQLMEQQLRQRRLQQNQEQQNQRGQGQGPGSGSGSSSSDEYRDNPRSVRFDHGVVAAAPTAPQEVECDDRKGHAFGSRERLRQDSNLSAAEWAFNPLDKERAAVMRAKSAKSLRAEERQKRLKKKKSAALNERSRKEYTFVLCAGMCLAFNSGYINGACLSGLLVPSGASVSVSAFTGSYTKSALSLAGGDSAGCGFLVSMILCFIGGSFLTAVINPKGKPYELGPQYGPTFLLGSTFLVISSILSELQPQNRGLFYFAAAANGLQNGMSSMYSGNLIRSSHYTGISTDIGLILGQVARGNRTSLWKLWVLLGLTSSFWTGGFVSFHATSHFRTHSLIFNAVFFFLIGVGLILFVMFINHVTLWQAAFGTWHWERALESLASVHQIRTSIQDSDGNEASSEFLMELFEKIDADGSGTIDEEELYDALQEAGMKVSRKGIKAMMKLADEDGDGTISKEEWELLVGGKVEVGRQNAREAADRALAELREAEEAKEREQEEGAMKNEEDGTDREQDADVEEGGGGNVKGEGEGEGSGFCSRNKVPGDATAWQPAVV